MRFNQNIYKTSDVLGSMLKNYHFIYKMICDPISFEKSKEMTILKCLKQIKRNSLQKYNIYQKINIFVIFL